jgi:seryl-tRNA synthetase
MYMIDGYDGERGAEVAGSRGYFMKVSIIIATRALYVHSFRDQLCFSNKPSFNWL